MCGVRTWSFSHTIDPPNTRHHSSGNRLVLHGVRMKSSIIRECLNLPTKCSRTEVDQWHNGPVHQEVPEDFVHSANFVKGSAYSDLYRASRANGTKLAIKRLRFYSEKDKNMVSGFPVAFVWLVLILHIILAYCRATHVVQPTPHEHSTLELIFVRFLRISSDRYRLDRPWLRVGLCSLRSRRQRIALG